MTVASTTPPTFDEYLSRPVTQGYLKKLARQISERSGESFESAKNDALSMLFIAHKSAAKSWIPARGSFVNWLNKKVDIQLKWQGRSRGTDVLALSDSLDSDDSLDLSEKLSDGRGSILDELEDIEKAHLMVARIESATHLGGREGLMMKMILDGKSLHEIGNEFGMTDRRMQQILVELVQARSVAEMAGQKELF